MSNGPKPTQIGTVPPILLTDDTIGVFTGDDVDWDGGGFAGDPIGTDQWKQPVRVATTATITIATALNSGDSIDGVTLATGDRVLVKDQATGSQNGIYIVGATPVRAADMDEDDEVLGAVVYVIAGTANAASAWKVTNTSAVTVDTTAIVWASLGAGTIPSGTFELAIEGGQSVIKAHGSMGSTETFDPTDGNVHTGTLNANCTFTLSAPSGSGECELELWLTQDGTGGRTITWPGSVTVVGTLSTTASTTSVVILTSLDGGTTWTAFVVGGGGSALTIKDEGTPLATAAASLDFVGPLVTASGATGAKTVTVSGALDDLTDVAITSPTAGDRVRYSGSAWVNSAAIWVPVMVEDGATGLWYVAVTGDGDAVMTEVS